MKSSTLFLYSLCLFVLSSVTMMAQNSVSGTVRDLQTKEPIIGATIYDKGTAKGTTTDAEGKFKLTVTSQSVLHITYVGYKPKDLPVNGKTLLTIDLEEDMVSLDQAVVIGYGVQKKSDLTGSVSSIQAKDLRNLPATNVTQTLQGKAAGVEVIQNSGSPGASTSIKIRGTGTVNNSDPLYVVDGIPMDNIDFLSSDDIEAIEILKDAASSAIYGSRAANGVVLVSTKSGADRTKPLITVNSYMGWQEAWKDPDVLTKDKYIYFQDYANNAYSRTELVDGKLQVQSDNLTLLKNGSNWWDVISRNGMIQKYSVSASGGNQNMNYYVSGNYQKTDGIIDISSYDQKSLTGKINSKLSKKTTLGLMVNYSNDARDVIDESGTWSVVKQALIFCPLVATIDNYGQYTYNTPVEMLRRASYDSGKNNFIGQVTFDWDILNDLHFTSRASITTYNQKDSHFEISNTSDQTINTNSYYLSRYTVDNTNLSWDNVLTYKKTLGEQHHLTLMGGQTLETNNNEAIFCSGTGYGGYNSNYNAMDFATVSQSTSGNGTGWRALGFIGRLSYDYAGKYLFQSNFRADGSSRFKKNRWGYFPSLSVGWKLSDEPFMENVEWLSLLKLRAGWGQLGNNRVGDYVYDTYVKAAGYYVYGQTNPTIQQAMSISQIGNENVTWERTQSSNIGLDMNLLNNRLSCSVDLFNKDTKDMLLQVPLAYYNGYASIPVQNAGSVNNKGLELQLDWKEKRGDFSYDVGGNISFVKNKVTSLGANNDPVYGGYVSELGYINKTMVGAPIGAFYGWKTAGIIQEGEDISNLATFKTDYAFGPGDMKFVDVNKDGVIDDNDKTFIGSPQPDFYYGFNVNVSYKNVDLKMFFQGVYGNKVYNATKYYLYSDVSRNGYVTNVAGDYFDAVWRGTPTNVQTDYRSNWAANPNGTVPAPNTNSTINDFNFRNSDFYIEDGSYLRLKNVQLGYSLPATLCKQLKLNSLRLYASATNLLTFTKYSGLDPEIGKTLDQESNNLYLGIDQGSYPQARTYTFGLIFDF